MKGDNLFETAKLLRTEAETYGILGMSRSSLRREWAKGAITPVHIGRSLRYTATEIQRYVDQLQVDAGAGIGDE